MYGNEAGVGAAIKTSGVPRSDLFVTTKVWRDDLRRDALLRSVEASAERLACAPIDLVLVHWPNPDVPLAETIGALNAVVQKGLVRHIGVSNFPSALMEEAVALSEAPILANQCEYHPGLDQSTLIAACRRMGAAFVSYRPLGQGSVLANPVIGTIAERHRRTPGQVVLRWHIQQPGVVALPRSGSPAHIAENLQVFDFALSDADMAAISALGDGRDRQVNPGWGAVWDQPEPTRLG